MRCITHILCIHVKDALVFSLIVLFFSRIVNVSLPKKTRNNGTLYALIFVHQAGVTPWQDPRQVHLVAHLTTYMVPKPPEISLISREEQTQVWSDGTWRWFLGKHGGRSKERCHRLFVQIYSSPCSQFGNSLNKPKKVESLYLMVNLLWSHRVWKKKLSRRNDAMPTLWQAAGLEAVPHQITQLPTGEPVWRSTLLVTTSCSTESTCPVMSTDTSECKEVETETHTHTHVQLTWASRWQNQSFTMILGHQSMFCFPVFQIPKW